MLPVLDFGSLTLLWSQPVAALQILTEDGGWKWVKHINNALVGQIVETSLTDRYVTELSV